MLANMKVLALLVAVLLAEVMSEKADKYEAKILKMHNDYRKQQKSSNIDKLVWSDTLAKEADDWVSNCDFKHQQAGRGENLAMNTAPNEESNVEQAINDWYNEIKDYNYASNSCKGTCGHYTQVIWHNTREVGCAMKRCPTMNMFGQSIENAWFFGCWYDPPGNFVGEAPYLTGAACSKCEAGKTCQDDLCA